MLLNAAPADFINESKLGLNVGDKVLQIGRKTKNGKYSSSCRIFRIEPYLIYQGLFFDGNDTYMAFKLPDRALVDATLLFAFIDDVPGVDPELILQDYDNNSILIFKAIFKTLH